MTETNAEWLEVVKADWNKKQRKHPFRPLSLEVENVEWLIEQAERVLKLETLLEGNDGMSVMEIRHQFVDLHRSSLNLEKENKRLREAFEEVDKELKRVYDSIEFSKCITVESLLEDIASIGGQLRQTLEPST